MSEELIYALSTLGDTGLTKFNELFKRLHTPGDDKDYDYNVRYQTVRYLEALGYCEFDYDRRRVYMCPPAFVLLPSFGLPKALLTGARTPALVNRIKQSVKNRKDRAAISRWRQRNTQLSLPDATVIEAVDTVTIQEIADENELTTALGSPAAWDLANHSISLSGVEQNLKFEPRAEVNWQRKDYSIQRLGFTEAKIDGEHRLSEYTNPDNLQRQHWLWYQNKSAVVNRDWGRYLILKTAGRKILSYDAQTQEFEVPLWVPLPCLFARALTLCSGLAPVIEVNTTNKEVPQKCLIQVYSDVPAEIAGIVATKLEQKVF